MVNVKATDWDARVQDKQAKIKLYERLEAIEQQVAILIREAKKAGWMVDA